MSHPQNSYVKNLIPNTSECKLYTEEVFLKMKLS